ncbi:unnamed protein product [Dovyalis caffra]|uniref:Uncharacterized protein n=1 Tax=Dovyalis caffra TaxID=77055 RepID=A0AAV1RX42_9ROSI|nr:unnamed protein product [Dovyalis caffra]
MDFLSLSRKELQALCKKNKIPANMTNIAMADALKVLHKVEGLDEFINAPKFDPQQSPKKAMPESPEIPQTSCRTSTRKKPFRIEPESSQKSLTRTRCTTRRTVAVEGHSSRKMETKMMESVGDQENNNVPKTPATRSSRRMAPAVSARRKVDAKKEELSSVQRVYSTRHSVRLLEKSMEELGLKDKGSVGPLKMDGLCKEIEDVELNEELASSCDTGANLLTVPQKISEKTIDNEELSCQNLDHPLEDRREIKHELQEERNSDELEDCNAKQEIGSAKCDNPDVLSLDTESAMNNELEEDNKNNDCEVDHCYRKVEGLNGRDEDSNESLEKSNPILVESSDKAVPMNQEPIYEKGIVKSGVMVSDSPTLKVCEYEDKNSEMISTEDKQHDNYDLQSNFAIVGESDSNRSDEANENGKAETAPEDASYQKSESRDETESGQLIAGSFLTNNEALVEVHVMDAEDLLDMIAHECHTFCNSDENPGSVNRMTSYCTQASDNDSGKIPHKVHERSSSETLVDITVMSQEEITMAAPPELGKNPASPYQRRVAGGAIPGQTGLSPFAADTLQGQFPRPTELSPRKSSTKKQPTIWKMIDALEINKENIDESGKNVELKKEKANNKVIGENISDELSLRQLRKMMKEKLQIANDNKHSEENNDTKVGKTRLALQTLPDQNWRHGAESEN